MQHAMAAKGRPHRTGSALGFGATLIVVGGLMGLAGISVPPVIERLDARQSRLVQLIDARDGARTSAAAMHAASQSLDRTWSAYNLKILRVQVGLGESATDDAHFIEHFRSRVLDQYNDLSPLDALDRVPGAIAGDAGFQAKREAFTLEFTDVRLAMRGLTAMLSDVLGHPDRRFNQSDSDAVQNFFAAEGELTARWEALMATIRSTDASASAAAEQAQAALESEERKGKVERLLDP